MIWLALEKHVGSSMNFDIFEGPKHLFHRTVKLLLKNSSREFKRLAPARNTMSSPELSRHLLEECLRLLMLTVRRIWGGIRYYTRQGYGTRVLFSFFDRIRKKSHRTLFVFLFFCQIPPLYTCMMVY